MKYLRLLLCITLFLPLSYGYSSAEENNISKYSFYILSQDRETAINTLREFADTQNGYIHYFSNKKIVMRIPSKSIPHLRNTLQDLGYLINEKERKQDVSLTILNLKTRLKAKQKLYSDIISLFPKSGLGETLDIERSIGKVIESIEGLKGSLNYYNNRIAMPVVNITLNQSSIRRKTDRTHWQWINRLSLENLMRDK